MSTPALKFDLQIKYGSEYGPDEERAVLEVLRQGAPTSGDACIRFEQEFAAYCGVAHARAVSNGTAALFLSLVALGIKPGDRILTTPITWIATAAAGATLGAEVDFVDIDPVTCNLDPNRLAAKLTPNTRAILPVHLYGQCCDLDPSSPSPGSTAFPSWRMPATRWAPSTAVARPVRSARPAASAFTSRRTSRPSARAAWS